MNYLRDALRRGSGCSNQKSLLDLMIHGRRSEVRRELGAAASVTPPQQQAAA
jgi:hypothetical protein